MTIDFKPSDVNLFERSPFPLVNTFNRVEMEFAAALLVRACVARGDVWQSILPLELGETMKADLEPGGIWETLKTNPYVRPDFSGLVEKGWTEWDESRHPAGSDPAVRFTEAGLERLRAHLRPPA
jgi:hypothetical protein